MYKKVNGNTILKVENVKRPKTTGETGTNAKMLKPGVGNVNRLKICER